MIWATAFCIYIWSRCIGNQYIEALLFQPQSVSLGLPAVMGKAVYRSLSSRGGGGGRNLDEDHDGDAEILVTESDAYYDSDGEVDERDMMPLKARQSATSVTFPEEEEEQEADIYNSDDSLLPTPYSLCTAALDMLLCLLVTIFLYTISLVGYRDHHEIMVLSRIAAPTFPLVLFCFLAYKSIFPWRRYFRPHHRSTAWMVLCQTFGAPWAGPVTFRDGMVGDILTSAVRPLQDILFTIFYISSGLQGWYAQGNFNRLMESSIIGVTGDTYNSLLSTNTGSFVDSADANAVPAMERNWLLHTVILPMGMVSPLWWRFLQNLRQTYDDQRRWPYLGNALKYFLAAQVGVVGVFQPNHKDSALFLMSFVGATLYQVWWDIMMDWELLERSQYGSWRLRSTRLYGNPKFYWIICVLNILLRFCWTLSFMPLTYLNESGNLTETFRGDVTALIGPAMACAEIIRRTLWALLRFEMEAIKMQRKERQELDAANMKGDFQDLVLEMKPMKVQGGNSLGQLKDKFSIDMSKMNKVQILAELCCYAAIFTGLGLTAAAHRGTL